VTSRSVTVNGKLGRSRGTLTPTPETTAPSRSRTSAIGGTFTSNASANHDWRYKLVAALTESRTTGRLSHAPHPHAQRQRHSSIADERGGWGCGRQRGTLILDRENRITINGGVTFSNARSTGVPHADLTATGPQRRSLLRPSTSTIFQRLSGQTSPAPPRHVQYLTINNFDRWYNHRGENEQ